MKKLIRSIALWVLLASVLLLSATSANAQCAFQSIIYGQTVSGSLSTTDCTDDVFGATYYADYYQFTGTAGDKIAIQMSSTSFDNWLVLTFPSGNMTNNDNGGGGTNARIPATSGYYTLPESGTYLLEATSYASNTTGSYTLSLTKEAVSNEGMANLVSGWNLLGNSSNTALNVASAFGDPSKVTSVWKWITSKASWAFYTPTQADRGAAYAASKGYDLMTSVAGGEGFWVNAKTSFTVALPTGAAIDSASFKNLASGWNLIAISDTLTPSAFNNALSTTTPAAGEIPTNFTSLWAWDTALAKWYLYAPSLDATGGLAAYIQPRGYLDFTVAGKKLGPGIGFWVNKTCGSTGGGCGGTAGEVTVPPSSNSQTITANRVSVTIPGGLLASPTKLAVTTPSSKAAQLPAPGTDAKILRSYDISLGDLVGFGKELTLEFPYNSGDSVPEGKNLWIYSLNENNNHWIAEHGEVDTVRKVVVVRTDHLSAWSAQYYPNYLSVGESYNHFNVYYNPNHAQPRTDKSSASYTMRDLANDTLDALESARAAYILAGFSPPAASTVDVAITDQPSGSSVDTHTNISLNRSALSSLTNLREDSAHELFHVIQNRYFTFKSGGAKQWWMEGTPDYAVATIAWTGPPLGGLTPSYFETSLLSDDKPHAYQMPQFIRYLVNNRGADFKAMWDFVAAQEPNFVTMAFTFNPGNAFSAFQNYVEKVTGKLFYEVWSDYVNYAMFGRSGLMTEVTASNLILSDTATGDRVLVKDLGSYAAKVVHVSVASSALTRSIQLSAIGLAADTTVEIWLLTSNDRATAVLKSVLVSDKDTASFTLATNESLYAVVVNTGAATRSVTVNALSNSDSAIVSCNGLEIVIGARNGLRLIGTANPTIAGMSSTCDFTYESACTAGTKNNITGTIDFSKGYVFEFCANDSCNYQGPNNFLGLGWNGSSWDMSGQYRCTGTGRYPTEPAQCLAPVTYTTQWDCNSSSYSIYAQRETDAWIRVLIKKPTPVASSLRAVRR